MTYRSWAPSSLRCLAALLGGQFEVAIAAEPAVRPWWDDFPAIVQTSDAAQAVRVNGSAALCGGADNPGWGLFAQRLAIASARQKVQALRAEKVHPLAWFEGFGTTQTYVAQLKRGPEGSWLRDTEGVTRVFSTHWSWQQFDGSGEAR